MLEDKVAIVTGGARGIGRATVELLAQHGARVVLADVDESAAVDAASQIDGSVEVHVGDLTQLGTPEAIVERAIDTWGRLDILVNNAGYTADAPLHTMTDEQFQDMLDIHTVAPFRMLRAAAPFLREPAKQERAEGREVLRKVINVTSTSGTMGNATQANYAAAKAGLVGLTKTMAKEWGPFRVNVNAVAFGLMDTRLTAAMPEGTRSLAEMLVPLGRAGTPMEAAGPILFLASPLADYVTGQVLTVNGGLSLGMSG